MVTYNATRWIRACLDSLKNQHFSEYSVYVIDNNSTDETVAIIEKEYPWVKLEISKKNLGFAGGNNVLMKKAFAEGCDAAVLLNQDTIAPENFLAEGVRVISDKKVGFASPKMVFKNGKIWWAGSKLYRGKELLLRPQFQIAEHIDKKADDSEKYDGEYETDYIPGTALFVRKDVVEKIGYLDEDFFMYSEDLDWSLRAKNGGYKLMYFSSTTLIHDTAFEKGKERPSLKRIWFKYSNYFRGVHLIVKKHFTLSEKIVWYVKLPITLFLTFIYEVV